MLTQVDEYGYTLTLMEGIIDYKKDKTDLYKEDMYVVTKCVRKKPRKKTLVWKLLVQCKDRSDYWIYMKGVKYSHPVEVS